MSHAGTLIKFTFAERDAARLREDTAEWAVAQGAAQADRWVRERLIADACRLFDLLGLADAELRRASRGGALPSHEYIRADADITALFSDWLGAARKLEAILAEDGGDVDGAGRFLDNVREASWMLGGADRALEALGMIELRDRAVDAARRGDVEPLFE